MESSPILALTQHFAQVDDPRIERTRLHRLIDILVIAICAVICGAESWDDMAEFGEVKQDWFATCLELLSVHPIPSYLRVASLRPSTRSSFGRRFWTGCGQCCRCCPVKPL